MATRALLGAAALAASAAGVTVTLRNDEPRLDTDGNILATGDGCITYDPDTARYYLWGTHYQACPEPDSNCYAGNGTIAPCQQWAEVAPGECCGWRNMTIASYSSPDLTSGSWRLEGRNILPILTEPGSPYNSAHGAYFEACGAFNRRTGFWTMWYLDRGYTKGTAVATAPGPVYATESDCARSCTLCNLAGTWFGSEPNIPIAITQTPISNSSAAVTCAAPAANWPTNATGVARIGSLSVQHGWCSGTCSATISGLDAAGPPCALISWGPGSSWCNAAVDPRCTYGAGAAAMRK